MSYTPTTAQLHDLADQLSDDHVDPLQWDEIEQSVDDAFEEHDMGAADVRAAAKRVQQILIYKIAPS